MHFSEIMHLLDMNEKFFPYIPPVTLLHPPMSIDIRSKFLVVPSELMDVVKFSSLVVPFEFIIEEYRLFNILLLQPPKIAVFITV